jgi:MFS family permease
MNGPLRLSSFRFLVAGRFISMLGTGVAPIAMAFAVLDLTGSVADLGLVVGARSLAQLVFLLAGGVAADRFPRHRVMVVSSVLAALTQAAVAIVVLTGAATILLLVVLSLVNGAVSALTVPAGSAVVAQAVPTALRRKANAINRMGTSAASIIGTAVGGVLVAAVGPGWGLAADAASFAIAALCFAFLRISPQRDAPPPATDGLSDLRDGWTEFITRTWVWVVVLGFAVVKLAFAGAIQVLGPVVADATFGRQGWGLVLAAQTAGVLAGTVVAMRLRPRRPLLAGVACLAGEAPLLAMLGGPAHLAILIPAAFLGGCMLSQFSIAWETSIQDHIPQRALARVYSYDALGSSLVVPAGQVATGPIAAAVGVRPALLGAAAIMLLAIAAMLLSRDVRRIGQPPSGCGPPTRSGAPPQLAGVRRDHTSMDRAASP